MAFEMGDRKRLIFLVFMVFMVGLAAYVWYPRMFGKSAPRRPTETVRQPPVLIEVPPPTQDKPAARPTPSPPQTARAPREAPRAPATPAPSPRRYGLEFPPFVSEAEADEYERRLQAAGLPTLRATAYLEDGLYTLIIGPFQSADRASEAMTELRTKPAAPSTPQEAEGGFVFSDGPYVLREVVRRAQEIKGKGHGVKIARAEGKLPLYLVRTAARLDSAQAQKLSEHYQKLGFPNRVVTGG